MPDLSDSARSPHDGPSIDGTQQQDHGATTQKGRRLVLASTSPRRKELIKKLHLPFEIIASQVDEPFEEDANPENLVINLATDKANDVYMRLTGGSPVPGLVVLGADTMVALNGKLLGKPIDHDDAYRMLKRLSGQKHEVYTGVALVYSGAPNSEKEIISGCEISKVYFRALGDEEIKSYITTGEPMDKAGAYALQDTGSAFVEKIDGCYTNIIGLPIPKVVALLRRVGIAVLGRSQP